MLILLLFVVYIGLGMWMFEYGFPKFQEKHPNIYLTDTQYNLVRFVFMIFWFPMIIVMIINLILGKQKLDIK